MLHILQIAIHVLFMTQCLHLELQTCLCDNLSIAVCSAVQTRNPGGRKLRLAENSVIEKGMLELEKD